MVLLATRAISIGDEITLSYIDTSQPRQSRRQKLSKMYRFDCDCERCQQEGEE
jgi:hypothetical protein